MSVTINGSTGVQLDDNDKQEFGTGDDLQVYHSGTESWIKNTTGDLIIRNEANPGDVYIQAGGAELGVKINKDGATELYHNNAQVFYTQEYGATIKRPSGGNTVLEVIGPEGTDAQISMFADDGDDNNDKWRLLAGSGTFYMQNYADGAWENSLVANGGGNTKLYHNNTEVFETKSDGAGIAGQLAITHNANVTAALYLKNTVTTGTSVYWVRADGTVVGSVSNPNDSSTSFNTTSDYRLKENQVVISDGITRLKTLKPYRFNFKGQSEVVDGFFAHEVSPAVPEAITGTKDETYTKDFDSLNMKAGDPKYQQIDQSKLVPLLTAALQEAITKIETLETKVAALEAA